MKQILLVLLSIVFTLFKNCEAAFNPLEVYKVDPTVYEIYKDDVANEGLAQSDNTSQATNDCASGAGPAGCTWSNTGETQYGRFGVIDSEEQKAFPVYFNMLRCKGNLYYYLKKRADNDFVVYHSPNNTIEA